MLPPWQHAIRLSCLFPLLMAGRTLAVSRRDYRVLENKAKVRRDEVMQIVRDSTMWGWSNWWAECHLQPANRPLLVMEVERAVHAERMAHYSA